jgi:NTE family protein
MLFHLGALWRLNDAGMLPRLDRVSSVSGGSIAAGVLARHWADLAFDGAGVAANFQATVAADLHRIAGRTIDIPAVVGGGLGAGSIGDRVAASYRRHLFGPRTLQDLPHHPRFVFNATNLQTGALWRFSKPYMADYTIGLVPYPRVTLGTAVAASSAFPPFLSPVVLKLDPSSFAAADRGPLHRPPFTHRAVLSDGGVYDNLGLETAWDRCSTVLISDGGGHFEPKERPWRNWPMQLLRVLGVIDNQVRALRKRQSIDAFKAPGPPDGTYWGIRTHIADYDIEGVLPCPPDRVRRLAETPTRLGRLRLAHQRRLVNWGFAVSDAALRRYIVPHLEPPKRFPYPQEAI